MIKAELIQKVSVRTGVERKAVSAVLEMFMQTVKHSLEKGENVYLREFGTFAVKKKAAKKARNILKSGDGYITTTINIPAHTVPCFKPSRKFINRVKKIINLIIVIN